MGMGMIVDNIQGKGNGKQGFRLIVVGVIIAVGV